MPAVLGDQLCIHGDLLEHALCIDRIWPAVAYAGGLLLVGLVDRLAPGIRPHARS